MAIRAEIIVNNCVDHISYWRMIFARCISIVSVTSAQIRRKTYGPGGIRTHDLAILALLLYRLSYWSMPCTWVRYIELRRLLRLTGIMVLNSARNNFLGSEVPSLSLHHEWIISRVVQLRRVRMCRDSSTSTFSRLWPFEQRLLWTIVLTILHIDECWVENDKLHFKRGDFRIFILFGTKNCKKEI